MIAVLFSVAAAEAGLRVAEEMRAPDGVKMRFDDIIGYEPVPYARIRVNGIVETLNREGFRGQDPSEVKPEGTVRILAVGDSIVQGFSTPEAQSWARLLGSKLGALTSDHVKYEVINVGVGGYVSWQALRRFEDKGLRYAPDAVILSVGWNDLIYSSLSYWTPRTDLTDIQQAYIRGAPSEPFLKRFLEKYSRLYAVAKRSRSVMTHERIARSAIQARRRPSGVPFNEEALTEYLKNIEMFRWSAAQRGVRMVLATWPTLLTRTNLLDEEVDEKMTHVYFCFPLSAAELFEWHGRYTAALRDYAKGHPDIVLADVDARFGGIEGAERQALFTDHAHLTPAGNALYADVARDAIRHALEGAS